MAWPGVRFTLILAAFCLSSHCGSAAEYWFGGEDPVVQADKHKSVPADYMDLFKPDSPWKSAAAHLAVFKVSTQFINRGTDDQIRAMLAGLRSRNLALAIEIGSLVPSPRCGTGIEGYATPPTVARVLSRLRRLGGTLASIDMDEPVWYGHEQTWQRVGQPGTIPCGDSINEIAREAAAFAATVHGVFPEARIGDIEPIGSRIPVQTLVSDILAFNARFAALTGQPLAHVHLDVAWRTEWQPAIVPLATGLRTQGTRFGPIVDGDLSDQTSRDWVQTSLRHLGEFMNALGGAPDDVLVQSWVPLPESMLPETDPASLTFLLRQSQLRVH